MVRSSRNSFKKIETIIWDEALVTSTNETSSDLLRSNQIIIYF